MNKYLEIEEKHFLIWKISTVLYLVFVFVLQHRSHITLRSFGTRSPTWWWSSPRSKAYILSSNKISSPGIITFFFNVLIIDCILVLLRFSILYLCLLLTGIGSWMFHMTLLYEMQLLDELPMVWGSSYMVYSLYKVG